jgi:RHS repeat-associated protein
MDRFKYAYDRNGNRLYRSNEMNHSFDELYHADGSSAGYDNFNRLTDFQRGTLSASVTGGTLDTINSETRSQVWTLDALGNWSTISTNGTGANRTHNKQNQITNSNFTYDGNGNATHTGSSSISYAYDAWNHLTSYNPPSTNNVVLYTYDAFGRRITETKGLLIGSPVNHLYYSANWQVILEQTVNSGGQGNGADPGGGTDGEPPIIRSIPNTNVSNRTAYVWSPVYVDAMVMRLKDATADGTYEERLYAQHDANFNVTSVLAKNGSNNWGAKERYAYDPYGAVTILNGAQGFDADTNGTTVLEWSNDANSTSDVAWRYLHQGGRYDSNDGLYNFRDRDYLPSLGRWLQQDPMRFVDGANVYAYVDARPTSVLDPTGLQVALAPSFAPPVSTTGRIVQIGAVEVGDLIPGGAVVVNTASGLAVLIEGAAIAQGQQAYQQNANPLTTEQALEQAQQQAIDKIGAMSDAQKEERRNECARLYQKYKKAQQQFSDKSCKNATTCDEITRAVDAVNKELGLRGAYIKAGCDAFDWNGKPPTADHIGQYVQKLATLANCLDKQKKLCGCDKNG